MNDGNGGVKSPVIAGLAVGIGLIVLFALYSPIYEYQNSSGFFPTYLRAAKDADYTPLLQLRIAGLRDSYIVGESIDFSVTQTAGGDCAFPDLVMIKDLQNNMIVKEWNGTEESAKFLGCRIYGNPAMSGMTWSSKWDEANPIIINQTGTYSVVAKHLFKTVHKEFRVAANDNGSDTSVEAATYFTSLAKNMDAVKALLEKYPDANSTVTANYYSKQFQEFQKYHPDGIVQYSASTKEERQLLVTVIFDRYNDPNNLPITIVQCTGQNYQATFVTEFPGTGVSEVRQC